MGDMLTKKMKILIVLLIGIVIGFQIHIAYGFESKGVIVVNNEDSILDVKDSCFLPPEVEEVEVEEVEIEEVKVEEVEIEKSIEEKIYEAFGNEGELALRIAKAESGLNPNAMNTNAKTGDYSIGLFQINLIGNLFEGRLIRAEYLGYTGERTREGLTKWLQNEDNNIMYAKSMSQTNGWRAWSTYKNGNY